MFDKAIIALTLTVSLAAGASTAVADPYCRKCPASCASMGLNKKDCRDISSSAGLCCVDVNDRGMDYVKEQDRVLASNQPVSQPGVSAAQDRCPAGFQPSEQKCSPQERQHGCKDIRLPSGLGCVHR